MVLDLANRSPFKLTSMSFWHVLIILWARLCFLVKEIPFQHYRIDSSFLSFHICSLLFWQWEPGSHLINLTYVTDLPLLPPALPWVNALLGLLELRCLALGHSPFVPSGHPPYPTQSLPLSSSVDTLSPHSSSDPPFQVTLLQGPYLVSIPLSELRIDSLFSK